MLIAAVSRPGDLFTFGFWLRSELMARRVSPCCPLGKLTRKLRQTVNGHVVPSFVVT